MHPSAVPAAPPPRPAVAVGVRSGASARPARVYLWRRAVVGAVLAGLLSASLWGAFQLGGLVGAQLVAPAVGTAPVPAPEAPQADS
ncbi:MAG: hypothetical protein OXG47_06480 [bacterium]|nr:hypothetical protein [bacterium]MCY3925787.1 hypothetical protein [bacterium]